jgi:hypothetical protein
MLPASTTSTMRGFLKKIVDGLERAGQILFVAVQMRENIALSAAIATVDGIIHAAVLFDERADAAVVRQLVRRAVVGAGILHEVLEFDARLVGHGGDAELEPA